MKRNNSTTQSNKARSNRWSSAWAFGLALVAASGGAAHADIFYDALPADPLANGDIVNSTIGALNVFGDSFDLQAADDFALTAAAGSAITNLSFDMATFTNMGANSLPPSVMVEFFADAGGSPADAATASSIIDSTDFASVTQFAFGGWPQHDGSNPPGFRVGLDLSGEGIVLGAGTWWVAVQGIGDDNVYSIMAAQPGGQAGALPHWRGGGIAHGNGFNDAGFGFDWVPTSQGGDAGDLAIRIEGSVVPAPGGAAVLALAGLAGLTRRRR